MSWAKAAASARVAGWLMLLSFCVLTDDVDVYVRVTAPVRAYQ